MSLLHDYFTTRNLQAFHRLLQRDRHGQSTAKDLPSSHDHGSGGGKSWKKGLVETDTFLDVNCKDWLGRTVLHLACVSLTSIEYIRVLLRHPQIDVNLADAENLWTPLHRALYSANIPAALLLLQRSDIDTTLKDLEGYTAFDLYNTTVEGTKPSAAPFYAELYTWGANRNAVLGLGDEDDRVDPSNVNISSKHDIQVVSKMPLSERFRPIHVQQVCMSKLHTGIVTTESTGNLRLCGLGSGGRLGASQQTQYHFKPVPMLNLTIIRITLGQDHTLVLTTSGEVYSWGLNRFSQLGYMVEASTTSINRHEEAIQHSPKRVVGPLRKEVVRGIAASRKASACWTSTTVFTWGTNTGQLGHFCGEIGYDKNAQPIQVLPRPVTKFTNPVVDLAMSDTVIAALLLNRNIECIWNDGHYRVHFPIHAFPSGIQPYRPPQSTRDSEICKITCCDDTFAALSFNGEVFTFTPSQPSSTESTPTGRSSGAVFKPQRVWALRKRFSSVKDVALGFDGSIIVCTESGHVYVRPRSTSGKSFKFERVPFLQRVAHVCANSTGAFGALRTDHKPKDIDIVGRSLSQDLKTVQPYLEFYRINDNTPDKRGSSLKMFPLLDTNDDVDEEPLDTEIAEDIVAAFEFFDVLRIEQTMRRAQGGSINYDQRLPFDADTVVHLQSGVMLPAHRVILASRCHTFEKLLGGGEGLSDSETNLRIRLVPAKPGPGFGVPKLTRLSIEGCHPLSVLILFRYLYSDEVLALWDRRVGTAVREQMHLLNITAERVKSELLSFARLLELRAFATAVEPSVKYKPMPTMMQDMQRLFDTVQSAPLDPSSPLFPDVVLHLSDKDVFTHSIILRSRTPLFSDFFGLADWTVKRWIGNRISLDMRPMKWHFMRYVVMFMCCGLDLEMFLTLEFIESVEELLLFLFEVLSYANELLLDRLILLCSSVILSHSNLNNACHVLTDATYYQVKPLVERLQDYISINLEVFLQRRMLDDVPEHLVRELAAFIRSRQVEKSPFSRSESYVAAMLEKNAEWLLLQDIPAPFVRSEPGKWLRKEPTTKVSSTPVLKASKSSLSSPSKRTDISSGQVLRRRISGDDIFLMDEPDVLVQSHRDSTPPTSSPQTWKPLSVIKVDMKTVMAEAASQNQMDSLRISGSSTGSTQRVPPTAGKTLIPRPNGTSITSTSRTGSSLPNASEQISPSPAVTRLSQPLVPGRQSSHLGPVITPTKQLQNKSRSVGNINNANVKAWSIPTVIQHAPKASPATSMSFVAIQHSQKTQEKAPVDKRSLREIQEEEESLQAEADFMKWWTAEEERVQQEALALAQFEAEIIRSESTFKKPDRKRRGRGNKNPTEHGNTSINNVADLSPPLASTSHEGSRQSKEHRRSQQRKASQKKDKGEC